MPTNTNVQVEYQMEPVYRRRPENVATEATVDTPLTPVARVSVQSLDAEAVPTEGMAVDKVGQLTEEQENDLAGIASNISILQDSYTRSFLEIGNLLIDAKKIHGRHGYWQKWVENELDLSLSKVQRLMRIAKRFRNKSPVPHLNYTNAEILTRIPERNMDEFMERLGYKGENAFEELVAKKTKRELENDVRTYLKSKQKVEGKPPEDEESTPASGPEDSVQKQLADVERTINELVGFVNDRKNDPQHEILISGLQQICESTLEKLPCAD